MSSLYDLDPRLFWEEVPEPQTDDDYWGRYKVRIRDDAGAADGTAWGYVYAHGKGWRVVAGDVETVFDTFDEALGSLIEPLP